MDPAVDGLVFDLDDTLYDFRGAFAAVVGDFYEQHLRATTSVSHADLHPPDHVVESVKELGQIL